MRNKLSKQEKLARKQYLKFNKKYTKQLIRIVKKDYGPWDNFLHSFFSVIVKHWQDYYKLGYNVWGKEIKDTPEYEEPNRPTRYEIACEMERLYNKWVEFRGCHIEYRDGIPTVVYDEKYILPDGTINIDLIGQDERALEKEFFDYYIEYSRDMWD